MKRYRFLFLKRLYTCNSAIALVIDMISNQEKRAIVNKCFVYSSTFTVKSARETEKTPVKGS